MTSETYIHVDDPVTCFTNEPQIANGIVTVRIGDGPYASNGCTLFLSRSSDCTTIADALLKAGELLRELEHAAEKLASDSDRDRRSTTERMEQ
jgi:hypothetical protein